MLNIGLHGENKNTFFLSETTRHRTLIIAMYNQLMNLNQVCYKIMALWPNMVSPRGSRNEKFNNLL